MFFTETMSYRVIDLRVNLNMSSPTMMNLVPALAMVQMVEEVHYFLHIKSDYSTNPYMT